jgi:thiol-disulfide isomerase/thioredoxin
MKWLYLTLFSLGAAGSALSAVVGETYDQVIAEKGKPTSFVEAGSVQILSYPDATIKLKDNVVVSIKAPEQSPTTRSAPAAPRPVTAPISVPTAAPAPEVPAGNLAWNTDYNAALDQAKSEHKHVLLLFTGSDWCIWCKRLDREILETNEFAQYAQDKLVLVELDYPHKKEQPYEVRIQNHSLEGKYNITGFPTVVVLDSAGKQVARLGYQEGGPGPFVARIQALGD